MMAPKNMRQYIQNKHAENQEPDDVQQRRARTAHMKLQPPGLPRPQSRADSPVPQAPQERLTGRGVSRSGQRGSLFGDTSYESSTTGSVTEVPLDNDEAHFRQLQEFDRMMGSANGRHAKGANLDEDDDDYDEENEAARRVHPYQTHHFMQNRGMAQLQSQDLWTGNSDAAQSEYQDSEMQSDPPQPNAVDDHAEGQFAKPAHTAKQAHAPVPSTINNQIEHRSDYISELNNNYHQGQVESQQADQHDNATKRKREGRAVETAELRENVATSHIPEIQAVGHLPDQIGTDATMSRDQPRTVTLNSATDIVRNQKSALLQPPSVGAYRVDYDLGKLKNMNFEKLMQESFDHDPSYHEEAGVKATERLEVELQKMLEKTPEMQQHFLSSLPLQAWQEAGEWFKAELAKLNERMLDSREKRRNITNKYEKQVAKRYEAVVLEQATFDTALSGMSETGNSVLIVGTPKRTRT